MKSKFTKEMEEKFMKELQDINPDSQSDNDDGYYQAEKIRLKQQMQQIRRRKNKDILQQLQKNTALEGSRMVQFEHEMGEVIRINNDKSSQVIHEQTVKAIKQKVAAQQNLSVYTLTDEQIPQKEVIHQMKKKNILYENFQTDLNKKLQLAALDRENNMMAREDQLSMKFQISFLSSFFKERFIEPNLRNPLQKDCKIQLFRTQPKSTFTNLQPMPFKDYNVLPKNSPQIAIRNIKKTKKNILKPISKKNHQVQINQINPQNLSQNKQGLLSQFKKQINEIDQLKQTQILDNTLKLYIQKIKFIFSEIQESCKSYRPKFIKKFLQIQEKSLNIDLSENNEHKQKTLQQVYGNMGNLQNLDKLKQLKITFQNLTDLKGIQMYQKIQTAALQHNCIKQIEYIKKCQKLIQINLSHNQLNKLKGLDQLKWLKYVNVSHNKIQKLNLPNDSLEVIFADHNIIQTFGIFGKNLRVFKANNNKIRKIEQFDQCYLLQQLQLRKNKIKCFQNLQNCILLRKLDLSQNCLQTPFKSEVIYLFLNEFYLNNNQLVQIPSLFLPSLQKLHLQHNKLREYKLNNKIYLPNLKILNLDQNSLEGFSFVWSMLLYSKNIQIIKYDDNQCFLVLRQKVRQLYEFILYKNMKYLKILNQNAVNIGLKKYYQSAYEIYLQKNETLNYKKSHLLEHLQRKIQFILKENQTISDIQRSFNRFSTTNTFVNYKSVEMSRNLLEIRDLVQNHKQQNSVLIIKDSIFYQNDQFQKQIIKSLHKIHSMVVKYLYRRRKRIAFYKKNQVLIDKRFRRVYQISQKCKIRKGFNEIHASTQKYTLNQAIILVQKICKGFIMRKKYQRVISKLKRQEDYDMEQEMQYVDLSEFQNVKTYQFNFDLPEHLDFSQFIIRPEVFEMLDKKNKKDKVKNNVIHQEVQQEQQNHQSPKINNFMNQTNQMERRRRQDEDDERLMKEWGFKNRQTLQAFKIKRRRKQQMKRKEIQKNMTAKQRYEKFKNNNR